MKSQLTGEDPDACKDWGQEEKGETEDEMVGCITNTMDMNLSKLWEIVKDMEACCGVLQSMGSQTVRHDWVTEQHYILLISLDFIISLVTHFLLETPSHLQFAS